MKKILTLMLVLALLAVTFVGCAPAEEEPTDDPKVETPAGDEDDKDEDDDKEEAPVGEAGAIASFGLGQVISIGSSRGASHERPTQAQADVTIAAVGFDEEGKVASVTLDVAQTSVGFDEDMKISSDLEETRTKKDKQEDYNMKGASEIGKEWYEQAEALENWMIGKTVEEITGMAVFERDPSHKNVPDVEELKSSVTITVEGYLAAVEEAWENKVEVENVEKVGLGVETYIHETNTRSAEGETTAQAQFDTYMAATAFDADGNVVGTQIDNAQVRVTFDEDGEVASDLEAELQTKKELEDGYNMKGASEIDKEWFEQIAALEEWMVGKSIDEITGMPVFERDPGHKHVPDVEELKSSVTITVEGYLGVVEEASDNAR